MHNAPRIRYVCMFMHNFIVIADNVEEKSKHKKAKKQFFLIELRYRDMLNGIDIRIQK